MKKLLTALAVLVYFVPTSMILVLCTISAQETQESSSLAAFVIPLLLMLAVCVLVVVNIVCALYSVIRSRTLTFRTVMVYKLCLIPFYIINFACWLLASMVFHIALVVWPIIPFIIAYTYFTMLGTSVYIIAKLFTLRRDGSITTKQFIIHFIWQITFAADVIDSIYLALKKKSQKRLIIFCCLFLLLLIGGGAIVGGSMIVTPTNVTIDGVTYRSGFYGEMFPMFGEVGDIGSETLQKETLYDDGRHKFRRVEFEGHDWVHSYVGGTTGGTVYCAESEWEQTRDYYADSANFTYYCGGKRYISEENGEYPKVDAQKFDELLAFANKKAMQTAYRLPEEAFDKGIHFVKESNDGYFRTGGGHEYFVHDGKLILVLYHDGGRNNGGIREVAVIDVPDELGKYFIDLMERYQQ